MDSEINHYETRVGASDELKTTGLDKVRDLGYQPLAYSFDRQFSSLAVIGGGTAEGHNDSFVLVQFEGSTEKYKQTTVEKEFLESAIAKHGYSVVEKSS